MKTKVQDGEMTWLKSRGVLEVKLELAFRFSDSQPSAFSTNLVRRRVTCNIICRSDLKRVELN